VDAGAVIEIHQLLGHYGHVVDAAAWDRFEELFTVDAVLDYTAVRAPRVLHGIEEIREYFRGANHPSAHHVTNIVVTETDGEVRVKSKFFAPYTRPSHDPKRWYGGDYDDVVVATPAGWRFSERTCTGRWLLGPDGEDDLPEHRRTW
jgi:3-phenylpropionate/cinnamic acid dioxygenase small subunit